VSIRPLPRRPDPLRDELLSSWIVRLANANHCSVPELCGYLGFDSEHPPETLEELQGANIERFGAITRLSSSVLEGMLLARRAEFPVECMSWSDFQHCPTCTRETPAVSMRHWRYAWSLNCGICGSELLPLRGPPSAGRPVSSRLRTRAVEGTRYLEQVYRYGSRPDFRRVCMTMQVVGVLEPRFHRSTLYSQDHHNRYAMLAALGLGKLRPMLATALILRCDPAVRSRLHSAFPHQRELLDRLVRLAGRLPHLRTMSGQRLTVRSQGLRTTSKITSRPEYLAAARQAINQLGETAERGELLRCAENILETTRQQPVDI
jgi:hypothetical protein